MIFDRIAAWVLSNPRIDLEAVLAGAAERAERKAVRHHATRAACEEAAESPDPWPMDDAGLAQASAKANMLYTLRTNALRHLASALSATTPVSNAKLAGIISRAA